MTRSIGGRRRNWKWQRRIRRSVGIYLRGRLINCLVFQFFQAMVRTLLGKEKAVRHLPVLIVIWIRLAMYGSKRKSTRLQHRVKGRTLPAGSVMRPIYY